ncbi:organic hydroperoxide resistance protein [Egicoccus halophilus]|uniref:Putative organic hydroperoxide resistance protein/OsmC-like protein n=1 Tax=Egicoccus halophilus TaxID=1670830 RepID=A0A8J3AG73_9ACTN|nr:organic hydroperoxide resistance protein [Egicoccus halophilus]GGI08092.1 putative organic hydroperoxide resistance protein/OsmC-like protein [Egicoccus halophilus]
MDALYTAQATSTGGGRDGHVRSTDGFVDLDVATPKELGGAGGATNPEQLFAAGYAACFHSALQSVARREGTEIAGSSVRAEVGIGPDGDGGFGLTVALHVELERVDRAVADALVAGAHQVCPYSNATRGNLDVDITSSVR